MADCKKFLETSLVLVGEIGINDYNYAILEGKSFKSVLAIVPKVVKAISLTINVRFNNEKYDFSTEKPLDKL